jgi:molybdate transport system permease protein
VGRRATGTPGAGVARLLGPMRRSRAPVPPLAIGVAVVGLAFFVVPLAALVQRIDWATFWADVTTPAALDALRLSLMCSVSATVLAVVLGLPLAWTLARADLPGRSIVRALVLLPMVLPPVVGGVALLAALSRQGTVGSWLYDIFGLPLTFSPAGAVLAQAFVAMPFFVITVEGGLRTLDRRYEDVAVTLGAGRWTTFARVSLPLIAPSLLAGGVLAWARALGEFGATITFAGNIRGRTQTLPLAVYSALETSPSAAIALSLVLVGASLVVLIALRDRWFIRA